MASLERLSCFLVLHVRFMGKRLEHICREVSIFLVGQLYLTSRTMSKANNPLNALLTQEGLNSPLVFFPIDSHISDDFPAAPV